MKGSTILTKFAINFKSLEAHQSNCDLSIEVCVKDLHNVSQQDHNFVKLGKRQLRSIPTNTADVKWTESTP